MKKLSGFTLIELMVVMAIIAILATAGLSAYTSYIKEARDTTRLQIAKQLGIKVEQLSGISGAPTADQLEAFLAAENFGYVLPEMSPIVAVLSSSIDRVFGTAFALPDIDPLHGKPVCLDGDNVSRIVCGFSYFQFSDGTYAIGYTVEKKDNKVNFFSDPVSAGRPAGVATETYASFIGNSPVVTIINGGTPSGGAPTIESAVSTVQAISLGSFSIASSKTVSEKNNYTNVDLGSTASVSESESESISESISESESLSEPPTTVGCSSIGQVCSDGTVYVTASLRTTVSNEGSMTQSAGITYCQNKGSGWRLPTISELVNICNNQATIGNFPRNASGYFSTTVWPNNPTYATITGFSSSNLCSTTGGSQTNTSMIRCVKDV